MLVTDLDGSLLTDDKTILERDMAAIDKFRDNGGLFTIATGRAGSNSRSIAEELRIDVPAVTYNGAAVHDFKKKCVLWQSLLPKNARQIMLQFKERFPTLGVDIMCGDDIYTISSNRRSQEHFDFIKVNPIRCSLDEVRTEDWTKILLVDEPEVIDGVVKYSEALDLSSINAVCSAPIFYEILPLGVSKWTGLQKLIKISGLQERFIVAVGDYMNDVDMIVNADLGFAVANAPDEVKARADFTVCDNNSGAIYEVIERVSLSL